MCREFPSVAVLLVCLVGFVSGVRADEPDSGQTREVPADPFAPVEGIVHVKCKMINVNERPTIAKGDVGYLVTVTLYFKRYEGEFDESRIVEHVEKKFHHWVPWESTGFEIDMLRTKKTPSPIEIEIGSMVCKFTHWSDDSMRMDCRWKSALRETRPLVNRAWRFGVDPAKAVADRELLETIVGGQMQIRDPAGPAELWIGVEVKPFPGKAGARAEGQPREPKRPPAQDADAVEHDDDADVEITTRAAEHTEEAPAADDPPATVN